MATKAPVDEQKLLDDPIEDWRLFSMTSAGINYDEAIILARATHADLHKIIDTWNNGCPLDLLVEIYK